MADLLDFAGVRAFTTNADAGAGYVARFYLSGTTTPVTVYTSSDLGTAHGTSVTADASGIFPAVWASSGDLKCTIETADGAVVQTIDPVFSYSADATGAAGVSFEPTVDLPFTNVQAAIEGAAASAASGFAPYGIGITGNATLLANIDATNIGAGVYRFDGTTTGTLPTGVAAADTGLVEHWRQASATAMQFLFHATTDRVFHRRMASSAWGTWREVITSNQAPAEGDILYRGASAWTRLAKGTDGQFLTLASGVPAWGGIEAMTSVISLSGAAPINVTTAITTSPSYVELWFNGASLDDVGNMFVQLGDTAFVTSGYDSTGNYSGSGTTATAGFIIRLEGPARALTGSMILRRTPGTQTWIATHNGQADGLNSYITGAGKVTLTGSLTRIRVTATAGNAFDGSGTVYAVYR